MCSIYKPKFLDMKQLLIIFLATALNFGAFAQTDNLFSKASDSDPAAKSVLDKLKTKYEAFSSLSAEFDLIIEIPEEDRIEQKGAMAQEGDKFRLELEGQTIISDGTTLWVHLPQNNEVQINDAEDFQDEGDMLSPQDILKKYESGEFVYILADEYMKDNTIIQQIEFKPTDSDADYYKMRLLVDKKKNTIKEMKAFSRDGSRYTFRMTKLVENDTFDKGFFSFDKSKFPNVDVQDLRL